MSEEKKGGFGLFINKKSAAAGQSTPPVSGNKPKDVKKRWMYVGIGVIGVVVVGSTLMGSNNGPKVPQQRKKVESMVSVTPPNVGKDEFTNQFANDLAGLRKEVQTLRSEKDATAKALEKLQAEKEAAAKPGANAGAAVPVIPPVGSGIVAPPVQGNTGGIGPIASNTPPAPPQPPVKVAPPSQTNSIPTLPTTARGGDMPLPPANSYGSSSDPMVFDAPGRAGNADAAGQAGGSATKASVKFNKNKNAGMLPAGAFAPVSLLNGLDAGTSQTTQSNPMPVLMNITDQATLPGAAKYKLKSCFVLGTGYGDLSAERVYIRFSRMSCVDRNDRLVLSQEVAGYVVDSDGKLGMRGVISDRQGARLGKSMLAGFAQGLASALGSAQGTTMSNLSTGGTTSSITGAAALRQSGLTGAQTATAQLAEFYLKEAQSIFPVISVDTGRTGTIVFTNSVSLNWTNGETQYVQEVKPTN